MLGGALFGGAGAVLGALSDGSITRCRSLGIKVTINDINSPLVYISFVADQAATLTKTTLSKDYIEKVSLASECMSLFSIIAGQNKVVRESMYNEKIEQISHNNTGSLSIPDEIMKYKAMLDNGIITLEAFGKSKKQIVKLGDI